ncbi:hypothetical protein GCM10009623_15230 [Nocardioides aestuarii]
MVLGMLVPLVQLGTASAAPPRPASIRVDAVLSAITAPDGTPASAVPSALVVAGQPFSIEVSFYDADGQPAAFSQDTTLAISTSAGSTNLPVPATGVAPGGATSATLSTTLAAPANQVSVTVSVPGLGGPRGVAPGTSTPAQRFDVLSSLRFEASAPETPFSAAVGGTDGCADATEAQPVCGIVTLPRGAVSSSVLLSTGLCDRAYARCGSSRGTVIQFLADLGGLYTPSAPAAVLVRCDKTLCGTGSIKKMGLSYSLLGNGALAAAPACPAKSTLGADQEACVDYVQSTRDNAGDTLLVLLLTRDARISVS